MTKAGYDYDNNASKVNKEKGVSIMKRILVLICMVLFLGSLVSSEDAAAARFINNNDGTITDTQTGEMWADRDNGSDINWFGAKSYCDGYGGGGKSDWRIPTIAELESLHNSGAYGSVIKQTGHTVTVWSSQTRGSQALIFNLLDGNRIWLDQSITTYIRVLPVRSGK